MFSKKKAADAAKPKKGGFSLPFGKKKAAAPSAPAKPPAAAPAPKPAGDAKPAAKAPAKAKAKGGGPLKLVLPLLVILALGAGIYFAYTKFIAPGGAPTANEQPALAQVSQDQADDTESLAAISKAAARQTRQAEAANAPDANAGNSNPAPGQVSAATNCVTAPKFISKLGLEGNPSFEISDTHRLSLLVPVPNSDAVSKYQNQSWSQAGLVGAFALDKNGNVYVAPSPRLGPGVKAARPQNVIYRVDTNTGNLSQYLTLPDPDAPSPENPFGIVGMAYDCDTNSLYVSSLVGSTAAKEAGHIYRVDLGLGAVAGRFDNVDALGLAVGNTTNGKVLYFGSARAPQLRAVNLEASGDFQGNVRDAGPLSGAQRALRLTLVAPSEMVAQAVEFNLANADTPQGSEIRFQYDPAADMWNPVN